MDGLHFQPMLEGEIDGGIKLVESARISFNASHSFEEQLDLHR